VPRVNPTENNAAPILFVNRILKYLKPSIKSHRCKCSFTKKSKMIDSSSALLTALEQLRLKLLDLTGRNRLINFKHPIGKSLQFVEGSPEAIFQKLVEAQNNSSIKIFGLPLPPQNTLVERNGRLARPEPKDWARSVGIPLSYDISGAEDESEKTDVRALMYEDDLAKHCRKIEREANLAIEETGANMLFLVLGFLEFPDQPGSDRLFSAPLICVPVKLQKKEISGIHHFSIQYTDEDISENLSLREKLRNDFGLVLPEFSDEPIDANSYFKDIQETIKNQVGFLVKKRVSLCMLSFGNMLMVRDLDPSKWPTTDGLNSLTDHPIVREIFEGRKDDGSAGLSLAEEHPVEEGPGANIPLVYDADSSQHSALVDVISLKKNLVIEGPPGTGKSQTITNLIAACLSEGQKVLFVSEKLAALEVVKNRLTMAGLDPFVLELHSNKTNKKQVLAEIKKRIDIIPNHSHDLPRLRQQLEAHRRDLKSYSDLINSVAHNAFGLTLHQIMWRAEKHRLHLRDHEKTLSQISIDDATYVSEFDFDRRVDCLGHLSSHYMVIGGFDSNSTFWGFYPDPLIPGDETRLTQIFEEANSWVSELVDSYKRFSSLLDGQLENISIEICREQLAQMRRLSSSANLGLPLHLTHGFFKDDSSGEKAAHAITKFAEEVASHNALFAKVKAAVKNESAVSKLMIDSLEKLQLIAGVLGVELGNPGEMRALLLELTELAESLSKANSAVIAFLTAKKIPFDASEKSIEQLTILAAAMARAPKEHLHLHGNHPFHQFILK
jgi:Cdc6-like AAA superfamily ATPase